MAQLEFEFMEGISIKDPYYEGCSDYWDGFVLTDNPYQEGTSAYADWEQGWRDQA